jgi:cysteine desulfurase
MNTPHQLYFDFAATTPIDPKVAEAMQQWVGTSSEQLKFGNTLSTHTWGWDASHAVEKAREQVAQFLNVPKAWVYFTSGATESNNWVIQSLASQTLDVEKQKEFHVISSPVEHSSVLKTLKYLEKIGRATVSWAKINQYGTVDPSQVFGLIRPETKLMSFMWVNNELGSINPIADLAKLARENKIYFHSDGTQALGKCEVDLEKTPVDFFSFSTHKIYGPQGAGALIIRGQNPKIELAPLFFGGGHERGLRSGTVNAAGIIGTGAAFEMLKNYKAETTHYEKLRSFLLEQLKAAGFKFEMNSPNDIGRIPHVVNICFVDKKIPPTFPGLALSRGSACLSNGETSISPVLKAIGLSDDMAQRSLRISIGRPTTEAQIAELVKVLKSSLKD